jgi:hypothetical protein
MQSAKIKMYEGGTNISLVQREKTRSKRIFILNTVTELISD